jgi:hypothetical protein
MAKGDHETLLRILESRFAAHATRHAGVDWASVAARLKAKPNAFTALAAMEATGGEPDVIGQDASGAILFVDCSAESPAGRRSACYDGPSA